LNTFQPINKKNEIFLLITKEVKLLKRGQNEDYNQRIKTTNQRNY